MKNFTKIISVILLFNIAVQTGTNAQCVQCDTNSNPSGNYASVGGMSSIASGQASLAMGLSTNAIGNYSIALGKFVTSNGASSVTIGRYLLTNTSPAMIIGCGYDESNYLQNSVPNSLMIGFNSNFPTLFIKGAMGSNYTGKIGIGNVTDPQAKLHIKADVNEDASVKLETIGAMHDATILFADDEHCIKAKLGLNMTFSVPAERNFVFENGSIGISTTMPQAKLHVNGDFQVGDEENPQPIRLFGSINAEGEHAVSFGEGNSATGECSFVTGSNSQALGDYSVAMGYGCNATENYSFAFGKNTLASQVYAFSFGKYSESTSAAAFSLGTYLKASDQYSMVLGKGYGFSNPLENNIQNSLMVGFNSTYPTFFIESSPGDLKTGSIGIGNITQPEAKLHILGDNDASRPDNASLYIQSTGDFYSSIWLGDKQHSIRTKPNENFVFSTAGNAFVFENGNVGLGTEEPVARLQVNNGDIFIEDIDRGIVMKSPDGNCWRGKLDNSGSLQFVQVNCDDLATGQEELQPGFATQVKIYPNPAGNQVFVSIDQALLGATLEITDENGKLLHSIKLINTDSFIDLTGFTGGMYIFKITGKDGKLVDTKKIIKA